MVRKINNINRLILPKQHYILQSHSRQSILKPLNSNSIVNFRSRDVTYVTIFWIDYARSYGLAETHADARSAFDS